MVLISFGYVIIKYQTLEITFQMRFPGRSEYSQNHERKRQQEITDPTGSRVLYFRKLPAASTK